MRGEASADNLTPHALTLRAVSVRMRGEASADGDVVWPVESAFLFQSACAGKRRQTGLDPNEVTDEVSVRMRGEASADVIENVLPALAGFQSACAGKRRQTLPQTGGKF